MALSATLAELETWIRQDADMQAPDDRVTSEECRNRINRSLAQLYDRLVLVDQEYFLRNTTIASTGAGTYDILLDGKTGIGIEVVQPTVGGTGTGYAVGEVIDLVQSGTPSSVAATALVTSVDPISGAVLALSLQSHGNGYGVGSISTPIGDTVTVLYASNLGGGGGVGTLVIESDFYKCKGVWAANGSVSMADNGLWTPMRRFNWEQQNALNQTNLYGGIDAVPLYRIMTQSGRDKLVIAPDGIGGSFRLWYYPAPPRLLMPSDRFDGRAGWDEWIVKDVAIQLLMAEESIEQAAALKNVRDEIWERLQLHAEDREAAQPQKIMDVTMLGRRPGPRWR